MKLKRVISLALAFLMLTIAAGCGNSGQQGTAKQLTDAEKQALLERAYVFTLPLMMMDATFVSSTNTIEPTATKAPANRFLHARNLATADFKSVVTPNVDTIYSQVFMDLAEDAVILEFPKTDRFCNVEVIDAYSNRIKIIDAAKFEKETEKFIFTTSSFRGEIDETLQEVQCPTPMMWIIVRTICNNKADEANVHAIQAKMDAYTYTQYKNGTRAQKPKGTYDESKNLIPSAHVLGLGMQAYFDRANQLLAQNPPFAEDKPMVEEIAKIGVGGGLTFDSTLFGENAEALWSSLVASITEITTKNSMAYIEQNGNWSYFGAPIAEFGTAYDYRAFIALVGFGANPVSVAVYPKTTQDAEGNRLNGANKYVLHFEKDQLPAVEESGFWSVTAYNSQDNFLIDNEIDRYCINDRSDAVYNPDGSLDIYIQAEKPTENLANWLPVAEGDFHFVLRVYLPREYIVANQWTAPSIYPVAEDILS